MRTQFKNDSKQCKTCTHREQLEMESGPTKTIKRIVRCELTAHIPMTLVCVFVRANDNYCRADKPHCEQKQNKK